MNSETYSTPDTLLRPYGSIFFPEIKIDIISRDGADYGKPEQVPQVKISVSGHGPEKEDES